MEAYSAPQDRQLQWANCYVIYVIHSSKKGYFDPEIYVLTDSALLLKYTAIKLHVTRT